MKIKYWIYKKKTKISERLKNMMKCIFSGENLRGIDRIPSSESLATRDYSASGYSSRPGDADPKLDTSNIEEAETSLRESGFLNYEEARALLGRLEYQKGNLEAALHVFEGIDIDAVIPKMKTSLSRTTLFSPRRHLRGEPAPPMSMHAVNLLFEAFFLKSESLQALGRFREAALSCKVILDTIESSLPDGLPETFSGDYKLQETLNKAVAILPELWKLAGDPQESILSYRRALLYHWNLDTQTRTKIEKEFAVFLLYSGTDANPPNLRSQAEGSFIPRNNIEESALLLLIILKKFVLGKIQWDPSILCHLSFALSISGDLTALAHQVEELPPGVVNRHETYNTLALCYYGEGEDSVALNLLRNLMNNQEINNNIVFQLLLASKIAGQNPDCLEESVKYARRVIDDSNRCTELAGVASCLLGISLSAQSRMTSSDSFRVLKQHEAIEALETSRAIMSDKSEFVLFHLSLENAEQRKLDSALYYAKELLRVDGGTSVKGWILLARILSAQKRFVDAEDVINAALDETGKWEQGELMRTKAKLQIAQGRLRDAIDTYTHLLAVLQVRSKNFGVHKKYLKNHKSIDRSLEMETWHDLANVYSSLSQWRDAEVCLSKSKAINCHSASRLHATGSLYEAQGLHEEALKSFEAALDIEPNHVPSLISTAIVLKKLSHRSLPVVKAFLTDALRLDRTNPSAWYNLGLLYKSDVGSSAYDAAECFEAAAVLQESSPIEPFR